MNGDFANYGIKDHNNDLTADQEMFIEDLDDVVRGFVRGETLSAKDARVALEAFLKNWPVDVLKELERE